MFEIFSALLLVSCALLLAGCSYRYSERENNTAAMVISLASAFIVADAILPLLISNQSQDTVTLLRMLDNLAFYAGIPLLASALVDFVWRFDWSKAAWGRWLLVLFALFELSRRGEFADSYRLLMVALSVISIATCLIKSDKPITRSALFTSAICLTGSLLLFGPASLDTAWQNAHYSQVSLALALLALTPVFRTNNTPRAESSS